MQERGYCRSIHWRRRSSAMIAWSESYIGCHWADLKLTSEARLDAFVNAKISLGRGLKGQVVSSNCMGSGCSRNRGVECRDCRSAQLADASRCEFDAIRTIVISSNEST